MPTILITGANRGLGLEWARQSLEAGWRVIATCRHPEAAGELQRLVDGQDRATVHRLDVTDAQALQSLRLDLETEPVDVLLNNAGVYLDKFEPGLGGMHFDAWERSFAVNTLGPARVTEAFLDNLSRSELKLVVAITSHMGSIGEISAPGAYAYRASKAALNAVMKGLSLELKARGIGVLLLHPGWVQTRMGGPDAPLRPDQSVAGMRELVEGFSLDRTGSFLRYNGTLIPW
jgi:NAD(P)-dependent dehydrogenase (short-subunit alcohol dehydrogenase family)